LSQIDQLQRTSQTQHAPLRDTRTRQTRLQGSQVILKIGPLGRLPEVHEAYYLFNRFNTEA
jgi:hypothetical protein